MPRILVIADDLTGAAEISGIAWRHGLPTRLFRDVGFITEPGVTVVDTDSRLSTPAGAIEILGRLLADIRLDDLDVVFKKTDSVLRGSVLTELEFVLERFGLKNALLVPQNPSRSRTISGGVYYVDGVPIDETAFANDPHHPALTAQAIRMLGSSETFETRVLEPGQAVPPEGIFIGSGATAAEIDSWAANIHPRLIPVGGADFFESILHAIGLHASEPPKPEVARQGGKRLFVCGTSVAASKSGAVALAKRFGVKRVSMPDVIIADLPAAEEATLEWAADIARTLERFGSALADIDHPTQLSGGRRLERAIGRMVAAAIERTPVDHLLMEGGATAAAVCREIRLAMFDAIAEIDPGIVTLRPIRKPTPLVTVKPGSYAWPESAWQSE